MTNFVQSPTKHFMEHFITMSSPSVHVHARHLSLEKLALAKAEFDKMEEMGFIRRSLSS